jgi:probable rRNA maturation factor
MIEFYSETDFQLTNPNEITDWISTIIVNEKHELGEITFVFCDDTYLHKLNVDFLNHDTLTDIISFDNSLGKEIHGEVYISIERVKENAEIFDVTFLDELHRVMIHGILHFCGYKDKSKEDSLLMKNKEDEALKVRVFL